MRLCVDLDSIVADFMAAIWYPYVQAGGDPSVGTKDVTSWDWAGIPRSELIRPIFLAPGFFASLNLVPGAYAALKLLHELGFEVFIVSAHCTEHSAAEKIGWVSKMLPFLPKENVVITKAKHIFRADVIVDDMPGNCEKFKAENPNGIALTIAYPYNDHPIYDGRYLGFEDPEMAWQQIVHHILLQMGPGSLASCNQLTKNQEKP